MGENFTRKWVGSMMLFQGVFPGQRREVRFGRVPDNSDNSGTSRVALKIARLSDAD